MTTGKNPTGTTDPDAWRRVGWAKWYAGRCEQAELQGRLIGIVSAIVGAYTLSPRSTAAGDCALRAYQDHVRPLLALIGEMRTWSQEQAEAYFDGLDSGQSIASGLVEAQPLDGPLPWDLYLQGYRHARSADQHYPTYLMHQLGAVVDGPDVWAGETA